MQIDTALILCAGFGRRLLPLTQTVPKPLLKIGELTLLEKTIKLVEKLKIKRIKIAENINLEYHKLVMIDHHQSPNDYATIMFSHPEISSTCELIFNIAVNLGKKELINKEISTCLYLGMMTDTGSFQYNGVNGKTHNTLSFFKFSISIQISKTFGCIL